MGVLSVALLAVEISHAPELVLIRPAAKPEDLGFALIQAFK
jgi:hypothetical protein